MSDYRSWSPSELTCSCSSSWYPCLNPLNHPSGLQQSLWTSNTTLTRLLTKIIETPSSSSGNVFSTCSKSPFQSSTSSSFIHSNSNSERDFFYQLHLRTSTCRCQTRHGSGSSRNSAPSSFLVLLCLESPVCFSRTIITRRISI